MSRYRDFRAKQTTVRLFDELAAQAEAGARAQHDSVNRLIVDALHAEVDGVRHDADFQSRVMRLAERDRQILDRLAQ